MGKKQFVDNTDFVNELQGSNVRNDDAMLASELKGPKQPKVKKTKVVKPKRPSSSPVAIDHEKLRKEKDDAFFIRIHCHKRDECCGGAAMGPCMYMEDQRPLNVGNDHEVDLVEFDEAYPAKKKELDEKVIAFNA